MKGQGQRPRWLLWVAGVAAFSALGGILMLFGPTTPIETVYRPERSGIEQAILRRVRDGKGYRTIEFYGGWYTVANKPYRMEFAARPGTYRVGDTLWLLYDPANPRSNLVYDHRDHSIHLDNADAGDLLIDFERIKGYVESLERGRKEKSGK